MDQMTSKEPGSCRAQPPPAEGEDPAFHSHGASPAPQRVPPGTSGHSGPLAFFEHSVPLLSPLASPELPWSAWRTLFPLSCHSPREGSGHDGGERREPHCSQPSWDVWTPVDGQCQREKSPLSRPRAWLITKQGCSLPPPSTQDFLSPMPCSHRASGPYTHTGRDQRARSQKRTQAHAPPANPTGRAMGHWDGGVLVGRSEPLPSAPTHPCRRPYGQRKPVMKGAKKSRILEGSPARLASPALHPKETEK